MNTKGFTLVELLAVIIILALLTLLASTSVTKLVKDSKEELSNTQIELIKSAAQMWGADNIDKLPSSGQCIYITLGDLKEYGFLDSSIVDANTNKEISNDLKIKMSSIETNHGTINITYEVDPNNINGCKKVGTKTLDDMCTYVNNGVAEKTVGAKYSCDFGAGAKNFYILELGTNPVSNTTLESDEVALILEGNYDTTTQYWCDQNGANPSNNVCAADGLTSKLDEIATAWTELERDQIGLPSMEQIMVADGKSEGAYTDYPSLSNAWLYNWPDNADYGNSAPYGYWSSSPRVGDSIDAWFVSYGGGVDYDYVGYGGNRGVRPVITLKLN